MLVIAVIGLAGMACGRDTSPPQERSDSPSGAPERAAARRVSRADLETLTLKNEFAGAGTITLVGGRYDEPAAPGSATTTTVMLTDKVAYGDLDADGTEDAVAIIETDPGGSGVFFELVAVVATPAGARPVASVSLGDRTDVTGISIAEGLVNVDLVTQGPEDPMCCPTAQEHRLYRLVDGALVRENASGEPMLVRGSG